MCGDIGEVEGADMIKVHCAHIRNEIRNEFLFPLPPQTASNAKMGENFTYHKKNYPMGETQK